MLDHLGEGLVGLTWYCYQFHYTVLRCKEMEWETWIPWKISRPHSCCAKMRTQIQYSFAQLVAPGKQSRKTWVNCVQKTSWLVMDCTKPTRRGVGTQNLSSLEHPLITPPNKAYTDLTVSFPKKSKHGHQYIMVREDVVAELILMVNPLYHIMCVPMLNYNWCLALRSVLSTSWVWPK